MARVCALNQKGIDDDDDDDVDDDDDDVDVSYIVTTV